MKRIVGAALLFLAVCADAKAELTTGIDLYKNCIAESGSVEHISCINFIDGAIHLVLLVQKLSPNTLPAVCMQVRYTDPADGFVAWASRHPEELGRRAGEVFAAAMFDASNCQSQLKILR